MSLSVCLFVYLIIMVVMLTTSHQLTVMCTRSAPHLALAVIYST